VGKKIVVDTDFKETLLIVPMLKKFGRIITAQLQLKTWGNTPLMA
jgi:hypothetical protein